VAYSRASLVEWAGKKIELSKRDRYVLMAVANSVGLERLGTYTTTEQLSAASGQSAAEVAKTACSSRSCPPRSRTGPSD
jgi:hypothetical protein